MSVMHDLNPETVAFLKKLASRKSAAETIVAEKIVSGGGRALLIMKGIGDRKRLRYERTGNRPEYYSESPQEGDTLMKQYPLTFAKFDSAR
jgi:hypothetical protein